MKKTIFLIALGVISLNLSSCKDNKQKEIKADALVEETPQNRDDMPIVGNDVHSPINKPEDLAAKAKENPLTTVAFSETDFDFKEVKKGKTVEHKYEIKNTGKNPLIISEVKPGCGCTAPDYSKAPILPGETGFVTLKFDSSNFEGVQHKTASVYANVEQLPIVLSFQANVVN